MAAGISDVLQDIAWIVGLIDARAAKPGLCGLYRRKFPIEGCARRELYNRQKILIMQCVTVISQVFDALTVNRRLKMAVDTLATIPRYYAMNCSPRDLPERAPWGLFI